MATEAAAWYHFWSAFSTYADGNMVCVGKEFWLFIKIRNWWKFFFYHEMKAWRPDRDSFTFKYFPNYKTKRDYCSSIAILKVYCNIFPFPVYLKSVYCLDYFSASTHMYSKCTVVASWLVMVNFVCELGCTVEWPDIGLTMISGCVFKDASGWD